MWILYDEKFVSIKFIIMNKWSCLGNDRNEAFVDEMMKLLEKNLEKSNFIKNLEKSNFIKNCCIF